MKTKVQQKTGKQITKQINLHNKQLCSTVIGLVFNQFIKEPSEMTCSIISIKIKSQKLTNMNYRTAVIFAVFIQKLQQIRLSEKPNNSV